MAEPNIGELLASTDEKRQKTVADLVSNSNVLYWMMKKEGNVTEDLQGRAIYEEFAYAQNSAYQAIDATQEIDLQFNNTLDAFVYTPKQSVVPVMISELEKAQNSGEMQILNLIKERGKVGETTMINELSTDLNGDGTGRSGKAFNGIKSYVVDTPTSGSVGGASRSTTSAIRNVATDLPTTYTGATSAANIEDRVLALKNQILTMGEKYLGYAGSTFFRYMATALRSRSRLVDEELKAAGFGDHIVIEGIPFFLAGGFNPQGGTVIAADRFYILCAKAFKFRTYKGYNMQALDKRVSTRQLVDVALRLCIGQFTCSDPARNAVGYDS
jgi:hypothetical protein